jgi:hypothetical protein
MLNLNLKSLGIGLILAVALYFTLLINGLGSLGILSFFAAAAIGGYIVGESPKMGAIHGAIIGFFGSILSILILAALVTLYSNQQVALLNNLIFAIAIFILYAFIGAIGGVIGAVISNYLMKRQ